MLVIDEYKRPQTLQEAYELCLDRNNLIIGGMLWLKMQNRHIHTAIDLCDLNLDTIEDLGDEIHIGAMCTLRQLELDDSLNTYTNNAMKKSVESIVGVQFRNLATVGGSLFGRYGFSDVCTMFLALDAYVELYHGGIVPMREFINMSMALKDVLVKVIVKKTPIKVSYQSQRNTKTDFPVLTCAVSQLNQQTYCVIGARPLKAILFEDSNHLLKDINDESIQAFSEYVVEQLQVGSNFRASAEYRKKIAKVLIKRSLNEIKEGNHGA